MRWSFTFIVLVAACNNLPGPKPAAQGAYGYVRQDDEDAMGGIEGLGICALPTQNAKGLSVTSDTPQTTTDVDGDYTLELPQGDYTLCLVDGGVAVKCDCEIEIDAGSQLYRNFLREATFDESPAHWEGSWYGANPQSSCIFMLAD